MKNLSIKESLSGNSYPGRGIMIGLNGEGTHVFMAYFIMGRSINSQNRIFLKTQDGIKTKAFDDSKMQDPSLIIYSPIRKIDNSIIVTNGDQTDTIYDFLANNKSFEDALRTRTFEPDAPNYTPRISGLISLSDNNFSYKLSILKSANGNVDCTCRYFFDYETPQKGLCHLIHTYNCDGNPIPSFDGEPTCVNIVSQAFDEFTTNVWSSLDSNNRVSLYTASISLKDGSENYKIINARETEEK